MSAIPPNWMSSVVGGVSAQGRAADAKSRESADQAKAVDNRAFAEKLQNVLDGADTETQVHSDSEGLGGQGRAFSDGDGQPDKRDDHPPADDAPTGGLDIEA